MFLIILHGLIEATLVAAKIRKEIGSAKGKRGKMQKNVELWQKSASLRKADKGNGTADARFARLLIELFP